MIVSKTMFSEKVPPQGAPLILHLQADMLDGAVVSCYRERKPTLGNKEHLVPISSDGSCVERRSVPNKIRIYIKSAHYALFWEVLTRNTAGAILILNHNNTN